MSGSLRNILTEAVILTVLCLGLLSSTFVSVGMDFIQVTSIYTWDTPPPKGCRLFACDGGDTASSYGDFASLVGCKPTLATYQSMFLIAAIAALGATCTVTVLLTSLASVLAAGRGAAAAHRRRQHNNDDEDKKRIMSSTEETLMNPRRVAMLLIACLLVALAFSTASIAVVYTGRGCIVDRIAALNTSSAAIQSNRNAYDTLVTFVDESIGGEFVAVAATSPSGIALIVASACALLAMPVAMGVFRKVSCLM